MLGFITVTKKPEPYSVILGKQSSADQKKKPAGRPSWYNPILCYLRKGLSRFKKNPSHRTNLTAWLRNLCESLMLTLSQKNAGSFVPGQQCLVSTGESCSFVPLIGLAGPCFQWPSKLLNLGNLRIFATSSFKILWCQVTEISLHECDPSLMVSPESMKTGK